MLRYATFSFNDNITVLFSTASSKGGRLCGGAEKLSANAIWNLGGGSDRQRHGCHQSKQGKGKINGEGIAGTGLTSDQSGAGWLLVS